MDNPVCDAMYNSNGGSRRMCTSILNLRQRCMRCVSCRAIRQGNIGGLALQKLPIVRGLVIIEFCPPPPPLADHALL